MRAVERGLDGAGLARARRDAAAAPTGSAAGGFLAEYHDVTSLARPGAYDPAELIRSALGAFAQRPRLLAAERARRRHIFVDEYQDTDPAQAELLAVLADGADELVLVGDPDQSIYAFRGADESAIRDVDERFGRGDPSRTWRSACPPLRRGAARRGRRVAARLPGPGRATAARSRRRRRRGGRRRPCSARPARRRRYIAGVLRAAHLDGRMPWSRMAVLVRSTPARCSALCAGR